MARTAQQSAVTDTDRTMRKRKAEPNAKDVKKRKADQDPKDVSKPIHKRAKSATVVNGNAKTAQAGPDTSMGDMDSDKLAGHFTQCISGQFSNITAIELEDKSLPRTAFCDTSSFSEARTAEHLTQFLDQFTPGGADELRRCEKVSSPHTLIIASAAIRAQDLIRAVRSYGSEDNKIAKLFAKHMKLQENIEYVQKTRFGIGVGTPHRIKELVEKAVLKTDDLKRVVLDVSFVDEKKRTILSQKDVFVALLDLLNLDAVKLRLVRGDTQVQVY